MPSRTEIAGPISAIGGASPINPLPISFVNTEAGYNAAAEKLIGRTITSCRFVPNADGVLPNGFHYQGAAFLLEVDGGLLKLALVPNGNGLEFTLLDSRWLPK